VVYLDLRGHGRSEWGDPASWGFELCADHVRGFSDALGIARVGGDEVAATAERVYGGDSLSVTTEAWDRCWRLFGPWVTGEQERARTIGNRELNANGLDLMRGFHVVDQLARVDCPTLVCVGELDPVAPAAAAREIVDALPSGGARLEVVEGAGHFP
jgi:pimeloyl-ACP methyl ester carboxylesterase